MRRASGRNQPITVIPSGGEESLLLRRYNYESDSSLHSECIVGISN